MHSFLSLNELCKEENGTIHITLHHTSHDCIYIYPQTHTHVIKV